MVADLAKFDSSADFDDSEPYFVDFEQLVAEFGPSVDFEAWLELEWELAAEHHTYSVGEALVGEPLRTG